jgi:ligand-binding SRPBCC domain-containing protein
MVTLEEITEIHAPIERCFDLARSVEVHLTGNIHCGEAAQATGGVVSGLISPGQQVTWRAKHFGVWFTLTSRITAFDQPTYFQDRMARGPFRSMSHDHFFRSLARDKTEMRDILCVAAPLGILGLVVEMTVLRRYMQALLHERNAAIQKIAESPEWHKYLNH